MRGAVRTGDVGAAEHRRVFRRVACLVPCLLVLALCLPLGPPSGDGLHARREVNRQPAPRWAGAARRAVTPSAAAAHQDDTGPACGPAAEVLASRPGATPRRVRRARTLPRPTDPPLPDRLGGPVRSGTPPPHGSASG